MKGFSTKLTILSYDLSDVNIHQIDILHLFHIFPFFFSRPSFNGNFCKEIVNKPLLRDVIIWAPML